MVDGGASLTYSAPFEVTGAGLHTVDFYSVDVAGNTESVESVQFTLAAPATLFSFPAGLQMIAVAEDYSNVPLSTALTGFTGTLAVWDPVSAQYDLTLPFRPPMCCRPGTGYWARFQVVRNLTDSGIPNSSAAMSIPLKAGWNMIGNPYPVAAPLSGITVAASGSATAVPILQRESGRPDSFDSLYSYPAGSTDYEPLDATGSGSLAPIHRILGVGALQDCSIIVSESQHHLK